MELSHLNHLNTLRQEVDFAQDYYPKEYLRSVLSSVKNIALVGASEKPHRDSYKVMDFLLLRGYRVFPVNPRLQGKKLLEQHCYASLSDIEAPIDMVDIFRNSDDAYQVTLDGISNNVPVMWMQLGVINLAAAEVAKAKGCHIIMNRCPVIELNY